MVRVYPYRLDEQLLGGRRVAVEGLVEPITRENDNSVERHARCSLEQHMEVRYEPEHGLFDLVFRDEERLVDSLLAEREGDRAGLDPARGPVGERVEARDLEKCPRFETRMHGR